MSAATVREVLARSTSYLTERGVEHPRLDAERLLAHTLGVDRIELYTSPERVLTEPQLTDCRALVVRRGAREPLQYVLGEWAFRGLTLSVDRRALIPRPETETVVERCLALLDGSPEPAVLDVGTGSGAIALAIAAELPGARVTGIDVSADALALARENATRTGLDIRLELHDLRDALPGGPWELVVSNPPYVRDEELADIAPEVAEWEPRTALVDEGQTTAIVDGATRVLATDGALVLETHGERGREVALLLEQHGFRDVVVTCDLAGRERVVEGRR